MGKIYRFRNHHIERNESLKFLDYHKYINNDNYMKKDFHGRCAYCNASKDNIMVSFEVDHFVPKKVFKGIDDSLVYKYDNLMYCCKKCNLAKGSKHSGDLSDNQRFFNPVLIDLNEIFFVKDGKICSENNKGLRIILDLKLYRPIHKIVWIVDKLNSQIEGIDALEESSSCSAILKAEKEKLYRYHHKYIKLLTIYYNTNEKKDYLVFDQVTAK